MKNTVLVLVPIIFILVFIFVFSQPTQFLEDNYMHNLEADYDYVTLSAG